MVDSSTGVPLLGNDGGYGTTSEVSGPKRRLGRLRGFPLTSLRSDGKKGKVLGALGAQEISRRPERWVCFAIHPQGDYR